MGNKIKNRLKNRGFSLLELIVVLLIITLLATFSVPQVQVWAAQNRAKKSIVQLIGDISKTKNIAVNTSIVKTDENITRRPLTAIVFKEDSYSIMQREGTSLSGWGGSSDVVIRNTQLHNNIKFLTVNGNGIDTSPVIVFTSTGQVKNTSNTVIAPTDFASQQCGGEDSPLKDSKIFQTVLEVAISDTATIYFYIEIGPSGEYFVCTNDSTTFSSGGKEIDV